MTRNVVKVCVIYKQFLGVDFTVLSIGKDTIVTKVFYKSTDNVTPHKHLNEQSGYVISGKYKLISGEKEYFLSEGDTYSIPANTEHSLQIIKAGEVVDVLSPIRQDYL
ncbi:cupin domain-containing protein [Dysgonomonas sp. GY617]|nr:cupin domain-containing protein [Dysgonomonas sp. GY617]